MQPTSDDLLAQFQHDWPREAEISRLLRTVDLQAAEIARLTAQTPPTTSYNTGTPRPYVLPMEGEEARHG